MARGALVVAAGIAITALVGLSRVYLGVHYMSDVNAGWALGAAAFSLCAGVALVGSTVRGMRGAARPSDLFVRQNGSGAAARPAEDRK
jgi:undecaprenyl-diphosphatase